MTTQQENICPLQRETNESPQFQLPTLCGSTVLGRQDPDLRRAAFAIDDAVESLERATELLQASSPPEFQELMNVLPGLNGIKTRLWERSKQ